MRESHFFGMGRILKKTTKMEKYYFGKQKHIYFFESLSYIFKCAVWFGRMNDHNRVISRGFSNVFIHIHKVSYFFHALSSVFMISHNFCLLFRYFSPVVTKLRQVFISYCAQSLVFMNVRQVSWMFIHVLSVSSMFIKFWTNIAAVHVRFECSQCEFAWGTRKFLGDAERFWQMVHQFCLKFSNVCPFFANVQHFSSALQFSSIHAHPRTLKLAKVHETCRKLKIDEKCRYPTVMKLDGNGRNRNWRNTKIDENRNQF